MAFDIPITVDVGVHILLCECGMIMTPTHQPLNESVFI